ncbi:putative Inositol hexakisphosphate kinase 2 [Paratrimastix pyriformis]|uniref:Kinase n=1 Tax=Paratrimastix pyriformis TaxID=342808 RepID=A0ABQ8UK22_9EUKA|nr:putative Inositol hexakisphosphate kinase 2 [Paratrimastix pyriformis]
MATICLYPHQVGGHKILLKSSKRGIILKPFDQKEYDFYESLRFFPEFLSFTCVYYGVTRCSLSSFSASDRPSHPQSLVGDYVMIQDITAGFQRPCVLDIKVGTRQYDDDAPPHKIRSHTLRSQTTTSGSLGLRICGMQVYQSTTLCYMCLDRHCGRALSKEAFPGTVRQFFHNGHRLCREVVRIVRAQISRIEALFTRQRSHRLYSSSLLLVYDGVMVAGPEERPADDLVCSTDVRIVDFAHATRLPAMDSRTRVPDEDYLSGIRTLLAILDGILAEPDLPPVITTAPSNRPCQSQSTAV